MMSYPHDLGLKFDDVCGDINGLGFALKEVSSELHGLGLEVTKGQLRSLGLGNPRIRRGGPKPIRNILTFNDFIYLLLSARGDDFGEGHEHDILLQFIDYHKQYLKKQ